MPVPKSWVAMVGLSLRRKPRRGKSWFTRENDFRLFAPWFHSCLAPTMATPLAVPLVARLPAGRPDQANPDNAGASASADTVNNVRSGSPRTASSRRSGNSTALIRPTQLRFVPRERPEPLPALRCEHCGGELKLVQIVLHNGRVLYSHRQPFLDSG